MARTASVPCGPPFGGWLWPRPGRAGAVAPAAVVPAPLLAPACFRLALGADSELQFGAELVGTVTRVPLYQWPVEGWVLGRVRRVCRRGGFSHVVRYASSSPHSAVVVATLLDAAEHGPGGRWHLLVPTGRPPGAGSRRGPGAQAV